MGLRPLPCYFLCRPLEAFGFLGSAKDLRFSKEANYSLACKKRCASQRVLRWEIVIVVTVVVIVVLVVIVIIVVIVVTLSFLLASVCSLKP